jgi:hypothetical protein
MKISFWVKHCHHRIFALRIPRGCRLMVIDAESAFKHADEVGPDGWLFLCELLLEHDIFLPKCPFVQTASDGRHWYLLVPKGFRVRSCVGLWPGIDILAAGSSVILPGSRTIAGEYRALRSFDECPIPEAPVALIKLIRKAQKAKRKPVTKGSRLPDGDMLVSHRQWWLLLRNKVFRSFWNRAKKMADTSLSAYEYHLAKACFCCGLNEQQTIYVIQKWWRKQGFERSLRKLRCAIVPAAWREVAPWVEQWHAGQAAARETHAATKTANMILAYMRDVGMPRTPASIAAALPIPRERVKKAMQRMVKAGTLLRTKEGYTVANTAGTFCCITTPL